MQTDDIVRNIKVDNEKLTSDMLRDLVNEHREGRGQEIAALEQRYRQKGLPILTRKTRNPNKIDERIPNDFFSDIIDTKQGYMGNEVLIEAEEQTEVLDKFHTLNYSIDQNSEMVKAAARDGVGYRLLYVPEGKSEIRVKQLQASETVLYEDASLGDTVYAMRYWHVDEITHQGFRRKVLKRTVVEWYDKENITYYIDNGRGEYTLDPAKTAQPHLFDGVPIIRFLNNEEAIGEVEKALALIDAYDTIVSATVSEIEQFRLAYLAVKDLGDVVSDEMLQRMEQTGILPMGKDGSASFITKDMAVDGVKVILDELRTNIYQFSRSIDLSKDFGGDLRVIGWQVALLNLEDSCKVTERKFSKALREQYRMVTAKWAEWGTTVDYLELTFTFTRNFPKDLGSEAKILIDLLGGVSRETAYRLVSFIDNPEDELKKVKQDSEFFGSMDEALQDGEPEPAEEPALDAPETADVQAQALNGAQISSVVEIVTMVAAKTLPEASAIEVLKVAIPSLSDEQARAIIGPAAAFEVKSEPENRSNPFQPPVDQGGEQGGEGDTP